MYLNLKVIFRRAVFALLVLSALTSLNLNSHINLRNLREINPECYNIVSDGGITRCWQKSDGGITRCWQKSDGGITRCQQYCYQVGLPLVAIPIHPASTLERIERLPSKKPSCMGCIGHDCIGCIWYTSQFDLNLRDRLTLGPFRHEVRTEFYPIRRPIPTIGPIGRYYSSVSCSQVGPPQIVNEPITGDRNGLITGDWRPKEKRLLYRPQYKIDICFQGGPPSEVIPLILDPIFKVLIGELDQIHRRRLQVLGFKNVTSGFLKSGIVYTLSGVFKKPYIGIKYPNTEQTEGVQPIRLLRKEKIRDLLQDYYHKKHSYSAALAFNEISRLIKHLD